MMVDGNSEAVLQINQLGKSFGGLRVIDDVSFAISRGSRSALIGPNGAGKTTLFNLISGVYQPDEGQILLDDQDLNGVAPQRRCRYGLARSFQNIRLMPHLSALENVMLGQTARAKGLGQLLPLARSRWAKQAKQALADAGLDSYPGQVVADLPYGVQKRIEVVRAMQAEPQLLLLDEPAAGLNDAESAELRQLLEQFSERGVTLLVVEHDMTFVHQLCEHVVVLNFGKKLFEGSPAQVQREPAVIEAYLGGDDGAA